MKGDEILSKIDSNMRGTTRKTDGLGRFSIPAEFRRALGIKPNDDVEVFLTKDDEIIIKKAKDVKQAYSNRKEVNKEISHCNRSD